MITTAGKQRVVRWYLKFWNLHSPSRPRLSMSGNLPLCLYSLFPPPQGREGVPLGRLVPKWRRIFGEILSLARGDFEQQTRSRDLPLSLNICYNYYIVHYHKTILKELDVGEHWEADEAVATPLFKRLSNAKIHKVTKYIINIYKN